MQVDMANAMYCSQQILIPPTLPPILKSYAKAAIRTQPRDLLSWSLSYFKAVAEGLPPPVKTRVEYPLMEAESGLTPGYLKVLLNQIGNVRTVSREDVLDKWKGICLDKKYAELLFKVGNFPMKVDWIKFVALAAGTIEKNLTGTMSLLCELLTEEPEGGSASIPIETFLNLYKYLAVLDCGPRQVESSESTEEKSTPELIEYSATKDEEKSEIWDELLREVGDRKSQLSAATDDIKGFDSREGLEVWPDIVPKNLKLQEEEKSYAMSEEVISDTGVPVWNEEQLTQEIETKELQGLEEVAREVETTEERKTTEVPFQVPPDEGKIETEKKEVVEKDKVDDEPVKAENDSVGEECVSSEEKSIKAEEIEEAPTEMPKAVDVPAVSTIVEPNTEIIMVPSPVGSKDSVCSEGRSIGSLSDLEKEASVGQPLMLTTSVQDVRVAKDDDEYKHLLEECVPESHFWTYIRGIGPPVCQEVIEEVEIYLRNCATKQSGMVMPRNLRHFLCPTLDGDTSEESYMPEEPLCDECVEEDKSERAKKLQVYCGDDIII